MRLQRTPPAGDVGPESEDGLSPLRSAGGREKTQPGRLPRATGRRLAFLSHFVICLACAAAAFFATVNGVPQMIFREDQSMMTSLIALLFVGASIYLGWLAWNVSATTNSGFGHLSERLAVMIGFIGTALGLSLQAKALAGGSASFEALATSLFTTMVGGVAAALIAIMTYSLEAGAERERRVADDALETPR